MQQDAFDKIDSITPIDRQKYMLELIIKICETDFSFETFSEVSPYFKNVINVLKQMNYSVYRSESFSNFENDLNKVLAERRKR